MANGFIERLQGVARWIGRRVPRRGLGYWLTAAVILAVTIWATPFIDAHLSLQSERDWLYQRLIQSPTNPNRPGAARLVLIKDDAFWGVMQHRLPTNRSYLAHIVEALDQDEASVIALDFDLRTPVQRAKAGDIPRIDPNDVYRPETEDLIRAIDKVARNRPIVLAKTIGGADNAKTFSFGTDAYQPYGICETLKGNGVWQNQSVAQGFELSGDAPRNISCGYIALMDDPRQVPPPVHVAGQTSTLDSFPMAIARARLPLPPNLSGRPYFAGFIEGDLVNNPLITVSAADLLADPGKYKRVIQGWPVVVGAAWHERGVDSGVLTDTHPTPIGRVSGAFIQENLAEALLTGRIYPGLTPQTLEAMEVATGVGAALFFAAVSGFWRKVAAIVVAMAALFCVQWLILLIFGVFFDAFAPVFALGLHALFDRLAGEREDEGPSLADHFVEALRHVRFPTLARGAAHVNPSPPPGGESPPD
jgi:CHASE2 domain-containing sensor protein